MEQAFTIAGHRVPVTVVKTAPNVVTQIKTLEKDGYLALQLGFGTKKAKQTSKPLQSHFKKSIKNQDTFPRFVKETRTDEVLELGTLVKPSEILKEGDLVKVTGISKGKGFAGGMKRWGFAGGPKTHGQSDRHRAPGSIGQGTDPGRVHKGKKMAGRMGGDQTTVANITVLKVDDNDGVVWLSGPIPGNRKGLVVLEKVGEDAHFQQLYSEDIPEEIVEQAMEAEADAADANKPVVEEPADAESSGPLRQSDSEASETKEESESGNQEEKKEEQK